MERGLIHVYRGDGKGKTSAALGLLLRAAGAGLRVTLARFLKDSRSAELTALQALPNVRLLPAPDTLPFLWEMSPEEKEAYAREVQALFRAACETPGDVLILDEALDAVDAGLLPEEALLSFLDHRPPALEVALTGRRASPALLARADYDSEIVCRRHPYHQGIRARRGIEY